ncbi:uncharacterized protein LOC128329350 isoform X2 [Hemicordylus capensis]|uniref:uncharacterized protein LOC128329350 isoform X2 n=1 Tax=Hemicordylus capensis TaxID=884348 RepID=UPI002303654C|nr:uncharacterized protein LOC128329350 isoform X2 [Hemicordylus capensis]
MEAEQQGPGPPATLGQLLQTLHELGFSERQVLDALQAGCLSAPEAADWLLQGHSLPRADPRAAMDAFNPPRPTQEVLGLSRPPAGSQPDLAAVAMRDSPERGGRLAFAEGQREQLAQQLRAERRAKQKEREVALQRIADDRRRLQAKTQLVQALPARAPPPGDRAASSTGQCLLVVRLPTGDSVRERFPAAASLESVRQRLFSLRPELSPAASFLQSFPKRHFSPADLLLPLQALGLAPSATLCVVEPGPEPSAPEGPAPSPPAPAPSGEGGAPGRPQVAAAEEEEEDRAQSGGPLPPPPPLPPLSLQASGQPAVPGSVLRTYEELAPTRPHHWGRGQRLNSEEPMEQDAPDPARQEPPPGEQPLPAAESRSDSLDLPLAVAQAAEERLQRAGSRRAPEAEERVPAPLPPVPPLFQLSLRGAAALLTAPSKQYCSSLASVTPALAEHLLAHLIRQGLLRPRSLRLFFGCALQQLSLDCYPYATNGLLRQLRAFPSLRHLSLLACSIITDQGLSVLQHLSRLQHLNLSACVKLTDHCLQFLTGLPQLSHLALDQTRVSDRGLAEFLLSAPPTLSHLSLNQTGVTESTLRLLPQFAPHLGALSVKQTGVTDVSALRQLEALQRLHLDETPVSEASLLALSSHPALSVLTLSGVRSVDGNRALELVSGLPLLQQLSLPSRHTVTDTGLASLGRLAGLAQLDLTDYSHVTDAGLQHLARLCRLRRLSLGNTLATDGGLCHIRGLQLLEELCLDRLCVSSRGVARCIVCLPHLQVLSLASTPVGDTVARLGIARCRQLLKVNLSRTRLTDRGLRFLGQVPLVQLNLEGSGVTALGVAALLASCPTIRSIRSRPLRLLAPEDVSDGEEEGEGEEPC